MALIYRKITEFFEKDTTSQQIINFQASEQSKARLEELIHKSKNSNLSSDEQSELELFLQYEHLLRLIKTHVKIYL